MYAKTFLGFAAHLEFFAENLTAALRGHFEN